MILETERIKLVPPAYTYLEKLFEVHHDPANQKYNPAGPATTADERPRRPGTAAAADGTGSPAAPGPGHQPEAGRGHAEEGRRAA